MRKSIFLLFGFIKKIGPPYSSWAIVYSRLKFGQVDVNYDGIDYKALYCYIGDREDYAEALIFENGDYVAFAERN